MDPPGPAAERAADPGSDPGRVVGDPAPVRADPAGGFIDGSGAGPAVGVVNVGEGVDVAAVEESPADGAATAEPVVDDTEVDELFAARRATRRALAESSAEEQPDIAIGASSTHASRTIPSAARRPRGRPQPGRASPSGADQTITRSGYRPDPGTAGVERPPNMGRSPHESDRCADWVAMRNENLEFNQLHLQRVLVRVRTRVFGQHSLESMLPLAIIPTTLLAFATRFGWIDPLFAQQENALFLTTLGLAAVWAPAAFFGERRRAAFVAKVGRMASLSGRKFAGARVAGLEVSGRAAVGANFSRSDLRDAMMVECDLSRANFSDALMSGATFKRSILAGADLRGATLERCRFQAADLTGVDASGASLRGAHLVRADLSRANLQFADLTGAHLDGARLASADLRGIRLRGASWDQTTTWPQGYPLLALEQRRWPNLIATIELKVRELIPSATILPRPTSLARTAASRPTPQRHSPQRQLIMRRGIAVAVMALIAGVLVTNAGTPGTQAAPANVAVQGSQSIRLTISAVGRDGAATVESHGLGDLASVINIVPFGKLVEVTADRSHPVDLRFAVTTESTAGDLVCEMRANGTLLRNSVAHAGQHTVVCEYFLT